LLENTFDRKRISLTPSLTLNSIARTLTLTSKHNNVFELTKFSRKCTVHYRYILFFRMGLSIKDARSQGGSSDEFFLIYDVSAWTRGVNQFGHFADRGVNFSLFCEGVLYGWPIAYKWRSQGFITGGVLSKRFNNDVTKTAFLQLRNICVISDAHAGEQESARVKNLDHKWQYCCAYAQPKGGYSNLQLCPWLRHSSIHAQCYEAVHKTTAQNREKLDPSYLVCKMFALAQPLLTVRTQHKISEKSQYVFCSEKCGRLHLKNPH